MWTFTIYGFQADPAGHRLNRPAPEVAAAYMRFCGCLAAFFPFGFMRAEFEEATSWQDIRNRVYVAYNGENYYIYYRHLHKFYKQHLVGPNIQVATNNTGPSTQHLTRSST